MGRPPPNWARLVRRTIPFVVLGGIVTPLILYLEDGDLLPNLLVGIPMGALFGFLSGAFFLRAGGFDQ